MADEPDQINTIITGLAETGWISIPNFLSDTQVAILRSHLQKKQQQGQFHLAGVGRGDAHMTNSRIRGDEIAWWESISSGAQGDFQQFIEGLRIALNQQLYLGAFEAELHFARYPAGAAYQKHIDNFQGRSPRLVTFILYLNNGWQADQGGQLRLYTGGAEDDLADVNQVVDILPEGGTLVTFLSERFYHEVLPATRERLSITGWLRRRE